MHKYLSPKGYVRGLLRAANVYGLSGLESLWANPEEPLCHPPVFFLGAPRSGSTLAVQVLTDALDFGYISNRHCRWFGAPVIAEWLFRPTANRPPSDYSSSQGVTRGPHAPAECGEWWYRFFRRTPPYMTLDEVDRRKMAGFRRSVVALTNALDHPILFKNLYAALRIQAIAHYFPESLFIVMHRDEVDNGHSLLEARYSRSGTYEVWFSVEPPDADRLKTLPAHEQVIEQIRHVHETINADLKRAGVSFARRFDLNYEQLCTDPGSIVDSVRGFLASNGVRMEKRNRVLPTSFNRGREVRIERALYDAMVSYARKGLGAKYV